MCELRVFTIPRVVVVLVVLLATAGGETEEPERHADALAHPAPAAAAARAPDAAAAATTEMPVRKGVAWLARSLCLRLEFGNGSAGMHPHALDGRARAASAAGRVRVGVLGGGGRGGRGGRRGRRRCRLRRR